MIYYPQSPDMLKVNPFYPISFPKNIACVWNQIHDIKHHNKCAHGTKQALETKFSRVQQNKCSAVGS